MSEGSAKDRLKAMNARYAALAKAAPQPMGAFRSLMIEASKDGVLQAKFKELVAVALAVHQNCSDCILFHVANARNHGASREDSPRCLQSRSRWAAARARSMPATRSPPSTSSGSSIRDDDASRPQTG